MNRDCNGTYYSVNGEMLYRCLYNGKILKQADIDASPHPDICGSCNRTIDATFLGELPTRQIVIIIDQVHIPSFGWVETERNSKVVSE